MNYAEGQGLHKEKWMCPGEKDKRLKGIRRGWKHTESIKKSVCILLRKKYAVCVLIGQKRPACFKRCKKDEKKEVFACRLRVFNALKRPVAGHSGTF